MLGHRRARISRSRSVGYRRTERANPVSPMYECAYQRIITARYSATSTSPKPFARKIIRRPLLLTGGRTHTLRVVVMECFHPMIMIMTLDDVVKLMIDVVEGKWSLDSLSCHLGPARMVYFQAMKCSMRKQRSSSRHQPKHHRISAS